MTEQPTPLPAPGKPHAYIAVTRTHSPHADRPEWDRRAVVIPAWDDKELVYARQRGEELLPIAPDGESGTRHGVETLALRPGLRLSNGMAEAVVLEQLLTPFAPGLWRVHFPGTRDDYATEAGLIACGYAPLPEWTAEQQAAARAFAAVGDKLDGHILDEPTYFTEGWMEWDSTRDALEAERADARTAYVALFDGDVPDPRVVLNQ